VRLALKTLRADKTNPYFGFSLGFLAGCIAAFACAAIENIFVNLVPIGGQPICFTVPLLWLLLAGLVSSCRKLFTDDHIKPVLAAHIETHQR
jgi:hypothetical protein